jgi:hypothetical protein
MITVVQTLGAGQQFSGSPGAGQISFDDVLLPSNDYVPIVANMAFRTTQLINFIVYFTHPLGATHGQIVALDETPDELSPNGYGGFAKMGCAITVPIMYRAASEGGPVPWGLSFHSGLLTATGQFVISYYSGPRPSGQG